MKTTLFKLLAFCQILWLASCGQVPENQVILELDIRNPKFDKLSLYYQRLTGFESKSFAINGDTLIRDTVMTEEPLFIHLSAKDMAEVYTEPGSRLRITLDTAGLINDRIQFKGQLANINEFLLERDVFVSENKLNPNTQEVLEPQDYLDYLDSIAIIKNEFLEAWEKQDPLHPFWTWQLVVSELENFEGLYEYPWDYHSKHGNHMTKEWRLRMTPNYLKYFDDAGLLTLPIFRDIADHYIFDNSINLSNQWIYKNNEKVKSGELDRPYLYEFGANLVIDSVSNDAIKSYLLYKLASRSLSNGELAPIQKVLDVFHQHCTNPELDDFIRQEEQAWERLQPGQPALEISGHLPDGTSWKLSDLKGKFVFVNVWSTWCGPCRAEFPDYIKLLEAYQNENIAFVMYSVDDSKSDWQSYLEENDMPGIQVLGLDGFPGQLSNDYKFSSIPRHLLFDPAGNILGTDLERPSFLLEIRYLDKFLNQTNP